MSAFATLISRLPCASPYSAAMTALPTPRRFLPLCHADFETLKILVLKACSPDAVLFLSHDPMR